MADSPPPPPRKADALKVEPAVAIAAATKPIAILRIMVLTPFVLSTPSLSESNPAVPIELQRAALSPGVQASESQLVVAEVAACVPCGWAPHLVHHRGDRRRRVGSPQSSGSLPPESLNRFGARAVQTAVLVIKR